MRGLAALAVVLHHNLLASRLLDGMLGGALRSSPLRLLATGRAPVLFFFVLSGFVLTRALRGRTQVIAGGGSRGAALTATRYFGWVVQRSLRLGAPVAAALLLSAVLYAISYVGEWPGESRWLANTLWTRPPTLASVTEQALLLSSLMGFDLDNVLWSLVHEWRISLILPFGLAAAAAGGRHGALMLVVGALGLAGLAAGPWGQETYLGPGILAQVKSTAYFVLPFAVGMALEQFEVHLTPTGGLLGTLLALLGLLGLARIGSDLADYAASAVLICLALQSGVLRHLLERRWLVGLGRISFSLYLVHVPVLSALHHRLHSALSMEALFLLCTVAALPAAGLFYAVVELPTHRLARRIIRPGRPGPQDSALTKTLAHPDLLDGTR